MTPDTLLQTLLIVDDNPENLDILQMLLTPEYRVRAATSGTLALKIARQFLPDLILLDVIMPDMDGYAVCRQLQEDPRTRDIPIIFVTSRSETEEEAYGLLLGAVDYLAKPVSPPILKARIRTHLSLYTARKHLKKQNIALREAVRMREEAEHLMRHDLKAPLNALVGIPAILLMDGNLTEEQREMLRTLEDTGWRMLGMMDLSLILWKMESGRYLPEPHPVDLIPMIRKILAELDGMIRQKKLRLSLCTEEKRGQPLRPLHEGDRFMVLAEDLLCHSLLSNLLKNAMEASLQGEVLELTFFFQEKEARLCIENSGEVPREIRETFFEKYVTSGKKGGTGLGTYSARLIARTLKGDILLDTGVRGRTRISLYLPTLPASP